MKTKSKSEKSAPVCVFCGGSSGCQFAIFNPKFPPFGTACVECEKTHDSLPGAEPAAALKAQSTAMSVIYIDGVACTLIAQVRRAGLPFTFQGTGKLVGVDYQCFDGGGICNQRFTREQAESLRDALHAYLTRRTATTIAKHPDGSLVTRYGESEREELPAPKPVRRKGRK